MLDFPRVAAFTKARAKEKLETAGVNEPAAAAAADSQILRDGVVVPGGKLPTVIVAHAPVFTAAAAAARRINLLQPVLNATAAFHQVRNNRISRSCNI